MTCVNTDWDSSLAGQSANKYFNVYMHMFCDPQFELPRTQPGDLWDDHHGRFVSHGEQNLRQFRFSIIMETG